MLLVDSEKEGVPLLVAVAVSLEENVSAIEALEEEVLDDVADIV